MWSRDWGKKGKETCRKLPYTYIFLNNALFSWGYLSQLLRYTGVSTTWSAPLLNHLNPQLPTFKQLKEPSPHGPLARVKEMLVECHDILSFAEGTSLSLQPPNSSDASPNLNPEICVHSCTKFLPLVVHALKYQVATKPLERLLRFHSLERNAAHPLCRSSPGCPHQRRAHLCGIPVVCAVVCSLDSSQSFRYQFISTSRSRASCRALSWLCPQGLRLLSLTFSGPFLGDLSFPPEERPDCFLNLLLSSEIWLPAAPVRAASILEVPVCLSGKMLRDCHQSNLNWFLLLSPSSALPSPAPTLTLSCRGHVTEPAALGMKGYLPLRFPDREVRQPLSVTSWNMEIQEQVSKTL